MNVSPNDLEFVEHFISDFDDPYYEGGSAATYGHARDAWMNPENNFEHLRPLFGKVSLSFLVPFPGEDHAQP